VNFAAAVGHAITCAPFRSSQAVSECFFASLHQKSIVWGHDIGDVRAPRHHDIFSHFAQHSQTMPSTSSVGAVLGYHWGLLA